MRKWARVTYQDVAGKRYKDREYGDLWFELTERRVYQTIDRKHNIPRNDIYVLRTDGVDITPAPGEFVIFNEFPYTLYVARNASDLPGADTPGIKLCDRCDLSRWKQYCHVNCRFRNTPVVLEEACRADIFGSIKVKCRKSRYESNTSDLFDTTDFMRFICRFGVEENRNYADRKPGDMWVNTRSWTVWQTVNRSEDVACTDIKVHIPYSRQKINVTPGDIVVSGPEPFKLFTVEDMSDIPGLDVVEGSGRRCGECDFAEHTGTSAPGNCRILCAEADAPLALIEAHHLPTRVHDTPESGDVASEQEGEVVVDVPDIPPAGYAPVGGTLLINGESYRCVDTHGVLDCANCALRPEGGIVRCSDVLCSATHRPESNNVRFELIQPPPAKRVWKPGEQVLLNGHVHTVLTAPCPACTDYIMFDQDNDANWTASAECAAHFEEAKYRPYTETELVDKLGAKLWRRSYDGKVYYEIIVAVDDSGACYTGTNGKWTSAEDMLCVHRYTHSNQRFGVIQVRRNGAWEDWKDPNREPTFCVGE